MKGRKPFGSLLSNQPFSLSATTLLILLSSFGQAYASLKTVPVPEPANLAEFVSDKAAAIRLGKALFWDMQVGSDGIQACASCHFHAGADSRAKNQLSPGMNNGGGGAPDKTFNLTASGGGGANYTLTAADFPFHKLSNPNDAGSTVLFDTDDSVSSQSVFKRNFVKLNALSAVDVCTHQIDPVFIVNGTNVRGVQVRNSPSVINAVFNFRNFWDGRANNDFNGVNSLGKTDPNAHIYKVVQGNIQQVAIAIPSASLASQAMEPPIDTEMSCANRSFATIGKKLLKKGIVPLGQQAVHPNDSVLGGLVKRKGRGLRTSYKKMVAQAFQPEYWRSPKSVVIGKEKFSLMSANFPLFFGLAIQLYQATLVSDETPFDQFADGNSTALSPQQQLGLEIFQTSGNCARCHSGLLLTEAPLGSSESPNVGFINIGVRPDAEDGGNILEPQQAKFKTTGLRNVELTGPYFHNGGYATLRQVMDFYVRGGDFSGPNKSPNMLSLRLDVEQENAVIAFLLALTDERVRWQKAPFDHPQLFIPDGQQGDQLSVIDDGSGKARDNILILPAIGANGAVQPLQPFLGLSPFQP
ncbi:MAG: cytochrome c peroxidase [Gammaproteobacteria bacterium]